jgi:hypothetical protein
MTAQPPDEKPGDEVPPDAPATTGTDICDECGGSGKVDGETCSACQGTGTVEAGVGGG